MKTAFRWLLRVLFVATAGVSVWWAVHQFVLPRLVHDRLLAALQRIGLDGSAVRIERVGAGRTVVSNLIIGSQDLLTIDSAEVTYDLTDAVAGRFKTIHLTGAVLRLTLRDGKIDLGQFAKIATSAGDTDRTLSFEKIELRNGVVLVDLPDQGAGKHLPISGSIAQRADGSLQVDLRIDLIDRWLEVAGDVNANADGARFDKANIYLSPGDIPLAAQGLTLRNASFTLRLTAEWAGDSITATLNEGSRIDAAGVALRVLPHAGMPLLSSGGDMPARVAARLESASPFSKQTDSYTASVERYSGDMVAHFGGSLRPISLTGSVTVEGGSVQMPSAALAVSGIRANVPITLHAPGGEHGVFTVGQVRVGRDVLPSLVGIVRMDDGRVEASADWTIADSLRIALAAEVTGDGGSVRVRMPATKLTDPLALGRAFGVLAALDITGEIGLDAAIGWGDAAAEPRITLELTGVDIAAADFDLAVTGIDAGIEIDRLGPLSTSSDQRITAETVRLGKLEFTDAFITARLETPSSLFIEQAQWTLGESGRFFVHAIRLDTADPFISTNVFIEDLNVGDWLTVLTNERVAATGSIFGRVPVSIDPSANRVLRLGKGYLHAESGGGTLRFSDPGTVSRLLQTTDPRFAPGGPDAAVRDDLAEALADFAYDKFRLDLVNKPGSDELMLSIQTSGRGRSGKQRQVGSLNLNIGDFELAANIALFTQTGLSRRVDRSLETLLPEGGASVRPGGAVREPTDADFDKFFD